MDPWLSMQSISNLRQREKERNKQGKLNAQKEAPQSHYKFT